MRLLKSKRRPGFHGLKLFSKIVNCHRRLKVVACSFGAQQVVRAIARLWLALPVTKLKHFGSEDSLGVIANDDLLD